MRALTDSSTRAFRELWATDPKRAAQWVSNVAAHAHVETPAVKALNAMLQVDAAELDRSGLQKLAESHPELQTPLGSLQAARGNTLGWSDHAHLDAPVFTGTVTVDDDQVKLSTPLGAFTLATPPGQWGSKWAAEVGAFNGTVVTVRGWPDEANGAIAVESFGPGDGGGYLQGRVTRTPDGQIAIQERPGKLVRITDAQLSARLEKFMRVAFILPGEPLATRKDDGTLDWHYDGNPGGYYMLTKLNPGEDSIYDADTPFEKTHVQATWGRFSPDRLGQRVFVYGAIADEHEGVVTDRVRKFTASWVSEPILPAWQKAAEAKGKELEVTKDPDAAVRALDPELQLLSPKGGFEPELDVLAQAMRLAEAWGVSKKNVTLVKQVDKHRRVQQDYRVGSKLASGPLDADGKKHGRWSEYVKDDATGKDVAALQGRYEHGQREGIWVQLADGRPVNAWQFENGKLKAAGHVDDQLRPHGAWTLVGRDGLHDGGEGEYEHGVRVRDWWYYQPGTSDYERVEVYHPNGRLAAEGSTEVAVVAGEKVDVRVGDWKLYDESGHHVRTLKYTADELIDGGTGEKVGGAS